MIKQYFTDGLIQIAILLSLLRTDLNSLNNNFMNYPEVQDIILGQTAAYIPTNFHNHYNTLNSLGGSIHPKAINNNFHSSIFEGLEALYEFQSFDGVNRDISAFLLSDPQPSMGVSSPGPTQPSIPLDLGSSLVSQSVVPHPSSTSPDQSAAPPVAEDVNNNNAADGSSHASGSVISEEAETISSASREEEEELPPPIHLATDPTEEDLDLIDVLYRQDLDLGVGKEAYDTELRIQQEKQCELELQRTRQKERELEAYRLKLEEERKLREQQWLEQHFTQDGETGEWMPVSSDPQQLPPTTHCNGSELPINMEEVWDAAMDLLRNQASEGEGETAFNASQFPSNPPTTSDFSAMFAPNFTQTNTSAGFSMENDSGYGLPTTTATSTSTAGPALSPSLEESWNDLLQFINSGNVGEAGPALSTSNPHAMGSPTLLQELASAHSALLQNASMPTPAPEISGLHQPTLNGSGLLPLTPDLNATTLPDSSNTSPLAWEPSDLMLGLTDLASSPDLMLPDMLDDVLKEAADLDMEDASNDSAVSLASSSPMQQDLSDVAAGGGVSPYEGLEGATGGSSSSYESGTSPNYSKMSKYDPDEFHCGSSFYSHGQSESSHTNFSSSNDSSHLGPSSSSSSPFSSSSSPSHHVHHNHTYTVPPGQTPREVKAYKEKPKHKGPQSRDEKRAREMNIPLTMSEMIDTPVEEFNEILSRCKLSDAQLQLVRDIRRRGKNKIAAQNCRRRKLDVIVHMEDDLGSLQEMKEKLVAEREALGAQMQEMKEKFSSLYSEIFFSLRDEQGNRYNPEEYTLQTATDGNVFLVPRSVPRRPNPDKEEPVGSRKRKKMEK